MDMISLVSMYNRIDHIAIAVNDLALANSFCKDTLGLELIEERETKGSKTAMISSVFSGGSFTVVLMQGSDPESQITKYIESYGTGVQHVAFNVDDLDLVVDNLKARGLSFATSIISGPGLRQAFTRREKNTGMMFEFIERNDNAGFEDNNVDELFSQLEAAELI